ncbi:MAG: helix-turn-helix transcriptional regulator [Aliihoeflea sp.]
MAQNILKVGDLARRPGLTLESRDDRLTMNAPLLRGTFVNRVLRKGLSVHASDVFEETDFVASSTQHAGLSCIFFIAGDVDVDIGDRSFGFHGNGGGLDGLLISSARADSFRRRSKGHQHIRHVVISADPQWLDVDGLSALTDHRSAASFTQDHLASQPWRVTARVAELVRRILVAPEDASQYECLLLESAAVEIVAEALAAATHQDLANSRQQLSRTEAARLSKAEQVIRSSTISALDVDKIASHAGVSASGLQRLFKAVYGESVIEHLRRIRLEEARKNLESGADSIQQAAVAAGYTSAANFSTAFRRKFGVSPKQVKRSN